MATSEELMQALGPLLDDLAKVDFKQDGAAECLNGSWPVDGEAMAAIRAMVVEGIAQGWFAPRGTPGMKWGRLAKSGDESCGFSVDGVVMNGAGPGHTHPNGELDLCFAIDGDPRFDGHPEGWVVYDPGSWHAPTVSGGAMAILYFLPGGAIEFGKATAD
jgi:hypothetical protein